MKKKMICTLMATVLCLSTSITALASPETMPDGSVFDAEYYAETYPDVKAAFGDNKEALYNHYLNFGKAEGRNPYSLKDMPTQDAISVKEKVAALGITYDPSRDADIVDMDTKYWPIKDSWHTWEPWNEQTQSWNYHYTRADYTNDPLYYEFAKELVKMHDERLVVLKQAKAEGTFDYESGWFPGDSFGLLVYDKIGEISFRDADREYLLNLLSNLIVDYVESILGTDITWCVSFGYVADLDEFYTDGIYARNRKMVELYPNTAGIGFRER